MMDPPRSESNLVSKPTASASKLESFKSKRKYVRKKAPGTFEFVGVNARSRNGCLSCKKRSKKCDENKPVCGLCLTKDRPCEWPFKAKNNKIISASSKGPIPSRSPNISFLLNHGSNPDPKTSVMVTKFPAAGTYSPVISPVDFNQQYTEKRANSKNSLMGITVLTSDEIEELDFSYNQELNGLQNTRRFLNNREGIKAATQNLTINKNAAYLTKEEQRLQAQQKINGFLLANRQIDSSILDGFCKLAEELCVFDPRFTILLDIIFKRTPSNPFLLKCLVTLGEIPISLPNVNEMIDEIRSIYSTSDSKCDTIVLLSACLLLTKGNKIDVGSSDIWYQFLILFREIMMRFNLLENITNSSDERKFLLYYFCHQVLHSSLSYSSILLGSKTCYKIMSNPYNGLCLPFDCLGPLLPCMSELIELSKEVKPVYDLLKNPEKINNWIYTEKFNTIIRKANRLDDKIHTTHPSKNDLRTVKIEEFETQLSLYELYQFSMQLSLRISIKRIPPAIPENQILLVKLFNLLRFLVHSSVRYSIYYALLISGISCVLECDRKEILQLLNDCKDVHNDDYNIDKIEIMIKESWVRNPDGMLCIDWFKMPEEFGWSIYFN